MEMVGHYNEFIYLDTGKFMAYFRPPPCHHFTGIITNQFLARYLPQEAGAILDTDGDEIRPRSTVIIISETYRAAVMIFRIVYHRNII